MHQRSSIKTNGEEKQPETEPITNTNTKHLQVQCQGSFKIEKQQFYKYDSQFTTTKTNHQFFVFH